jgi:hypothetical protein
MSPTPDLVQEPIMNLISKTSPRELFQIIRGRKACGFSSEDVQESLAEAQTGNECPRGALCNCNTGSCLV